MKKYIHNGIEYSSLWEPKRLFSNISFPAEPTEGQLAELGVTVMTVEPAAPTQEELEEQRKSEIMARLDEIDRLSIRPLRAIAKNTATDYDIEKLSELEEEAERLRGEM